MNNLSDRTGWLFTDKLPMAGEPASRLVFSGDLHQALANSSGPVVCRLVDCGCDPGSRHLMWAFNASLTLRQFSAQCAQRALQAAQALTGWEPPAELTEALATKTRWDEGNATVKEITAAREAAWRVRSTTAISQHSRNDALVCIDEAVLAVAAALGVPRSASERNAAWTSAYEALEHSCLSLSAASAGVDPTEEIRKPLLDLLEQLLITELSFCQLRAAAEPPRPATMGGAVNASRSVDPDLGAMP